MDAASTAPIGAPSTPSPRSGSVQSHAPQTEGRHGQSLLALTALGVVFGDIGTSPLYTFSTALTATGPTPGAEQVLGVV